MDLGLKGRVAIVAASSQGLGKAVAMGLAREEIPRGSFFSHRGFFHSPFFLVFFACLLAAPVVRGTAWRWLALVWASAAITHPLLDMLTDGGSGVMLLFPFSTVRLFFPWRPIRVSPLSIARFFDRAGTILWSELPFCAAAVAAGLAVRRIAATGRRY